MKSSCKVASVLVWTVYCISNSTSGTFSFESDDSKIRISGEYIKPTRSNKLECNELLPEKDWIGAENGYVLRSLSITWADLDVSVDVPSRYICGFFDTPSQSTTNPLDLKLMRTNGGNQVILNNVLEGFDYTFQMLLYVDPRGNVEQVTLPFGSLAPEFYSTGVYIQ
jgi:hypothetical protein